MVKWYQLDFQVKVQFWHRWLSIWAWSAIQATTRSRHELKSRIEVHVDNQVNAWVPINPDSQVKTGFQVDPDSQVDSNSRVKTDSLVAPDSQVKTHKSTLTHKSTPTYKSTLTPRSSRLKLRWRGGDFSINIPFPPSFGREFQGEKSFLSTKEYHTQPSEENHSKPRSFTLKGKWHTNCLLYTSPSPRD